MITNDPISYSIKDFFANETFYEEKIAPINQTVELELPKDKKGYFELTVYKNGETAGVTSYSVIDEYDFDSVDPAESPFGVNTSLRKNPQGVNEDALNREIRILGAKSIRDGSEWRSTELEKGVYTPQLNDTEVRELAEKYNIDYLYVAGYDNPLYDKNASTNEGQTPWSSEGRAAFAAWTAWLAEDYKYIGVYNEWNGGFGKRGDSPADSKPLYYHLLAKEVYNAVEDHSKTTLVGPAFAAGGYEGGADFMQSLGELGTLNYLDVIAGNAYRLDMTPEFISERFKLIDEIIRKNNGGQSKEMWVTETGYPIYGDITEEKSAKYLVPLFVNAFSAGVKRVFWYNLADYGINREDREQNYGLIRHCKSSMGANTAKPSFSAYAVMTRKLTGLRYAENISDTVNCHRFTDGQKDCLVLWSYEGGEYKINTSKTAVLTDMMGNSREIAPVDGVIALEVTEYPIYLEL